MSDDDRDAILARRRMFIAAALASGATVATGLGAYAVFAPCLAPVPTTTGPVPGAGATPCLTPVTVTLDAGPADAGVDAPDAGQDVEAVRTPPRPCLSVIAPEPHPEAPGPDPLPCLSPPRR